MGLVKMVHMDQAPTYRLPLRFRRYQIAGLTSPALLKGDGAYEAHHYGSVVGGDYGSGYGG